MKKHRMSFKLNEIQAMKHGLQERIKRDNISEQDKILEQNLINELQGFIDNLVYRYTEESK